MFVSYSHSNIVLLELLLTHNLWCVLPLVTRLLMQYFVVRELIWLSQCLRHDTLIRPQRIIVNFAALIVIRDFGNPWATLHPAAIHTYPCLSSISMSFFEKLYCTHAFGNRPVVQFPQCTNPYPTMRHFVTEMLFLLENGTLWNIYLM